MQERDYTFYEVVYGTELEVMREADHWLCDRLRAFSFSLSALALSTGTPSPEMVKHLWL